MNSREASAKIIGRWLANGDFPDRMISADLPDRAFVRELVYGAVKQKRLLEWVIERFSRSKPDADILPHLLSGAYQIMFMNSPPYASVHETVEAAKAFIANRKIGYLNSVLRRISENRNAC
jgi:16S rRNA (cytosine967-C5)-methyltransferase